MTGMLNAAAGYERSLHRGRRSGRVYETPVNVLSTGDGFLMALAYGRENTDWVKNIVAAGGCELRTGGRVFQVESPRVYHDETRHDMPPVQRQVLRLLGAADFLSVKIVRQA